VSGKLKAIRILSTNPRPRAKKKKKGPPRRPAKRGAATGQRKYVVEGFTPGKIGGTFRYLNTGGTWGGRAGGRRFSSEAEATGAARKCAMPANMNFCRAVPA
jgi:hypothetical protein